MDPEVTDAEVQIPDDVSSCTSIDVVLQFSTQHRVYRAMLLMREPSGLLPEAMLPEQVCISLSGQPPTLVMLAAWDPGTSCSCRHQKSGL